MLCKPRRERETITWISSDHDETLKTSRFPAILIDSSGDSPYCKKWLSIVSETEQRI